jgi:GNAT superfamily N-acetyltransferase
MQQDSDDGAAWRAMRRDDLGAVCAIATAVHPDHPERPEVFAERLALAPAGCRVLDGGARGPLGYALSHPWRLDLGPPALDSLLGALPAVPDAWYLHDIALLPEARGGGQAAGIVAALLAEAAAAGIGQAMLVAIPGKDRYWARRGFDDAPIAGPGPAARLAAYGAGARLMLAPTAPVLG